MAFQNKFPICGLGEIISPGEYYVVSTLQKHVEEVKNLEKELTETMNEISSVFPSDISLITHKSVAVRSRTECDTWMRGEIKRKLEGNTYKIYVVDHGVTCNEPKENLRIIVNRHFTDVEPLSFKLCLYGILPPQDLSENNFTNKWEYRAFKFVNSVLANISKVHVKKIYILDRVVFGDIILFDSPNSEGRSLRKLLVDSKYAMYSEQDYREKVMGMEPSFEISQDFEFYSELQHYDSLSSTNYMPSVSQPASYKARNFHSLWKENFSSQPFKCFPTQNSRNASAKSLDHVPKKNVKYVPQEKRFDYFSPKSVNNHSANLSNTLENKNSSRKFQILRHHDHQTKVNKLNDTEKQKRYKTKSNKSRFNATVEFATDDFNIEDLSEKFSRSNNLQTNIEKVKTTLLPEKDDSGYELSIFKKLKDFDGFSTASSFEESTIRGSINEDSDSDSFTLYIDEDLDQSVQKLDNEEQVDYNIKVFILFKDSSVAPVDFLKNLNISSDIIMNLEQIGNFKNLTYIQRWAIPSILRGNNMVIIGPTNSGKSLSYIIALSELIQDELIFEKVQKANGPLLIILCSDSETCERFYIIIRLLLHKKLKLKKGYRNVNVHFIHGNECEKDKWIHLTNGCDVVITTPHCLARLLRYPTIMTLDRVGFLVIDDAHILSEEPFLSQLKLILNKTKLSSECQKIICGKKWSFQVSKMIRLICNPSAFLFGSQLEAAIYAKLEPQVFLLESSIKIHKIYDLIRNKIGKRKILIACDDKSEVLLLDKIFRAKGHAPMIAHYGTLALEMKEFRENWKHSKVPQICIFSDDILPELLIYDAEVLVHYSLPYKSKSDFAYRFSTLMNNYNNHLNTENPEEKLDVLIFLDDQDHIQLPHVIEFIIRLGGKVPENVIRLSEEIKIKIELNKKDMLLCQDLFKFGKCYSKKNCEKRHAINKEIDCIENTIKGFVKFDVKQVHDVVHLSVRLIENYFDGKIKETFEDLTSQITSELDQYYENEENRKSPDTIGIINMYAVNLTDLNESTIFRAKIVEYINFDDEKKPKEVRVKLVDLGSMVNVAVSVIYELPEKFKKYPPQIVDVYICNFLPRDFDRKWSEAAINFSRSLFLEELKSNQSWIGNVVLSLNDSLVLDSVKKIHFLDKISTNVIDICLKSKFLSEGIVEHNEGHLKDLALLCKNAHIPMGCKSENRDSDIEVDVTEPQWSYFENELVNVHLIYAENTSSIFVRLIKYEDLLFKLEQECHEEAKKLIMINCSNVNNYTTAVSYIVGSYCLALYIDKWQRARIESIGNQYTVYFIDHGDFYTTENILPISDKLLLQLPAQAIECSLNGIKHDVGCCSKVFDEIYAFSENGTADLYAYVVESDLKPEITKGKKYGINILNSKNISLNKILIDSKLMKPWKESNTELENNTFISYDIEDYRELEASSDSTFSSSEVITNENSNMCEDDEDNFESSECFFDLNVDFIEDENAQSYLEDFMVQNFSHLGNKNNITNMSKEEAGAETAEKCISAHQLLSKVRRKSKSPSLDFVIKTRNENTLQEVTCYTPQVFWSQTNSQVKLRIMLNNALSYDLKCMPRNILFRCLNDGKLYVVDLKLFGTICVEFTDIQIKTFFVQIVLQKLCLIKWSRLHADKTKFQWIKFDTENAFRSETSHIQDLYKRKIMQVKRGHVKQNSALRNEISLMSSSSEESDVAFEISCDSESSTEESFYGYVDSK